MTKGLIKCLLAVLPSMVQAGVNTGNTNTAQLFAKENNLQMVTTHATENARVELSEFFAIIQDDSVLLQWAVFGEAGSNYFEIQRTSNARSWEVVALVKGGSSEGLVNNYSAADHEPMRGQSFYRLRQVSADGSSKYSKTIAVYYSGEYRSKTVTTGSADGAFILKNRSLTNRTTELYNNTGHRVIFKASKAGEDTRIDLRKMPAGVYTLRINKGIITPSIIKLVKE